MSSKIDKMDREQEAKLVNAIQKAATRARFSKTPREDLLISQLQNAGIGSAFAKVAARAFNKRCTIDHMTHTAEATRGGDFPIVDPDSVYQRMSGQLPKKAFVENSYVFQVRDAGSGMKKAASASLPVRRPVTSMVPSEKLSLTDFVARLNSGFQKLASFTEKRIRQLNGLDKKVQQGAQHIAKLLMKHANARQIFDAFTWRYDNDLLRDTLKDYLPSDAVFTKRAHLCVQPQPFLEHKMDALMLLKIAHMSRGQQLQRTMEFLIPLVKSASALRDAMTDAVLSGELDKHASALTSIVLPAATMGSMGASFADYMADAAQALGPALAEAGKNENSPISPITYIDTGFLTSDRQLDQRAAIADLLADKDLSMYDPVDISQAFRKTLQTDKALERPDKRELLRVLIRTRLAQTNKLSPADIAALMETIKASSSSQGLTQEHFNAIIDSLSAEAQKPVKLRQLAAAVASSLPRFKKTKQLMQNVAGVPGTKGSAKGKQAQIIIVPVKGAKGARGGRNRGAKVHAGAGVP